MILSIFNSQGKRIHSMECITWTLHNIRDPNGKSLTIRFTQENDAVLRSLLIQQVIDNKKYHFILHDNEDRRILISNCEFKLFGCLYEDMTYEFIFNYGFYTSLFHHSVSEESLIEQYLDAMIKGEINLNLSHENVSTRIHFKKILDKEIGELYE